MNIKGQTIIFISSIFKQGSYELLNIFFLFQGLIKKFIVTKICHQVLRLSLRKGRISYWFFCLPLINYYLDFLRWNNNSNTFIIGAFTEAEIQVRIDEPSAESYHWRKCNCKDRREVNFKRISLWPFLSGLRTFLNCSKLFFLSNALKCDSGSSP